MDDVVERLRPLEEAAEERSLILDIVNSKPFQMRRVQDQKAAPAPTAVAQVR